MKTASVLCKYSVGIDCSKDELVCGILSVDTTQKNVLKSARTFKNSSFGFSQLHVWIK